MPVCSWSWSSFASDFQYLIKTFPALCVMASTATMPACARVAATALSGIVASEPSLPVELTLPVYTLKSRNLVYYLPGRKSVVVVKMVVVAKEPAGQLMSGLQTMASMGRLHSIWRLLQA